MIGLIAATAAGAAGRDRLAAAWPDRTRRYDGPVREGINRAFAECDQLVCFLAAGAVIRLIAPLLASKDTDPGVVCVDEAGQHAVALLGGHSGGANALAEAVSGVLGCRPVITTATDQAGLPGLDTLGWPVEGAAAAVTRAMLDGVPVHLDTPQGIHPLPALPPNVRPAAGAAHLGVPPPQVGGGSGGRPPGDTCTLRVTDLLAEAEPRTAVLRPPSLVVGVGASRGVPADEALGLIREVLAEGGLSPRSVSRLSTVDAKACEPGLVEAASRLGVSLVPHPAAALAAVPVPNPSTAVAAAVGTPSVCEAAALIGGDAELLVAKRKTAHCTAAVARHRPRGRLAIVGLGPGARDLLTPRAREELRRASTVVGLDQYVAQIRDLLRPGTRVLESGLGAEEQRARTAVAEATAGHAVALVGSGDAGIYAMASPALAAAGNNIDVVGVPGVTASLAAAAILGAPLGHDHVSISLSDLHTPWDVIEQRVHAAAEADLVVTFYNPRSSTRDWQLPKALRILAEYRSPTTPVGSVHGASRADERSIVTTLAGFDVTAVDMSTVVIVGNAATHTTAGRIITPRGYRWQP